MFIYIWNRSLHAIVTSSIVLILRGLVLLLLLLKSFAWNLLSTALMICPCLNSLESLCRGRWSPVLLNILCCTCGSWSIWNPSTCLTRSLIIYLIHSDSRWGLKLFYWLSIRYSHSYWNWICLNRLLISIILLDYILLLLINISTWI